MIYAIDSKMMEEFREKKKNWGKNRICSLAYPIKVVLNYLGLQLEYYEFHHMIKIFTESIWYPSLPPNHFWRTENVKSMNIN